MKKLLGEHKIQTYRFENIDALISKCKGFDESSQIKKSHFINTVLLGAVLSAKEPCFLLGAVLEFIERIDHEKILAHYNFEAFELWLNHHSGLSFEENYHVRAKVVGKRIERGDYQVLFPIGMGKVYEGTHFVTAHKSPDLDTTVASFWGWVDAFGARVSDALHIWNLPDGPPKSQIEIDLIFKEVFGAAVFTHLPKTRNALSLTAHDLMTQIGLQRKPLSSSIAQIDHERDRCAVIAVDDDGYYLGDWRSFDVEGVRQVIILLSSCLRWFESKLQLELIELFAKEKLKESDVRQVLKKLLEKKVIESSPAADFSHKQRTLVGDFIAKVLELENGLESTLEAFASKLSQLGQISFSGVEGLIARMKDAGLFDVHGNLIDNRPKMFHFMQAIVERLQNSIIKIRNRLETLDIALKAKQQVFARMPTVVDERTDVEEIKNKMGNYTSLTVVDADGDKKYPTGVVYASDIRKNILGTVSLRDFCNRDEMTIPSYLDVISVIDHHKSALNTFSAPMAIVSDAQSSNTICAMKAFEINDAPNIGPYFIHPDRMFMEYLHFLYAIIDDTDLLSKVSGVDVQCVVSLLNRLKSIMNGRSETILSLDDLPRDKNYPKKAAKRILQNEDMYSIYRKVYEYREKEVEKNLTLCAKGHASNLFADTKEQNKCCRIGQTKIFKVNLDTFIKHQEEIKHVWLEKAKSVFKEKSEVDLHIHMISTIVSAEEVYKGTTGVYDHLDELWIWIPDTDIAVEHLKLFLNAFQSSLGLKDNYLSVEFNGSNAQEMKAIFDESFMPIKQTFGISKLPVAVLRYNAGSLNSRKAMVSPFLPKI